MLILALCGGFFWVLGSIGFCLGAPLIGFAIALGVLEGCERVAMWLDSLRLSSPRCTRYSTGRSSKKHQEKRGSTRFAC